MAAEPVPDACPRSKMDDGSHSALFYDGGVCDWCGEKGNGGLAAASEYYRAGLPGDSDEGEAVSHDVWGADFGQVGGTCPHNCSHRGSHGGACMTCGCPTSALPGRPAPTATTTGAAPQARRRRGR
jgi:hypothetical protein